jgi:hypothetical protein
MFFRQALKLHGEPRSITLDGFEPSHTALRRMGMRNEFNYRWVCGQYTSFPITLYKSERYVFSRKSAAQREFLGFALAVHRRCRLAPSWGNPRRVKIALQSISMPAVPSVLDQ